MQVYSTWNCLIGTLKILTGNIKVSLSTKELRQKEISEVLASLRQSHRQYQHLELNL